jgi:plastocyanin
MRRYLTVALPLCAAFLAVLLAPGLIRAQAAPQTVTLTVTEFSISPADLTVVQGQTVHFVVNNTGKFPHSISFQKDGKVLNVFAAPIPGGKSGEADFTFEESGTWIMFCPVANHAERGMTGMAMVTALNAPGMPTTGQPADQSVLLAGLLGLALLAGGLVVRRRQAGRSI